MSQRHDPPMVRAMVNALHDRDIDPQSTVKAILALVEAGFPASDIHELWNDVKQMAKDQMTIRVANMERRR